MQLSLTGSGQKGALSVVNITFSLPKHRAVLHLTKKDCKCLEPPKGVSGGGAAGLGKDILTSAIPL